MHPWSHLACKHPVRVTKDSHTAKNWIQTQNRAVSHLKRLSYSNKSSQNIKEPYADEVINVENLLVELACAQLHSGSSVRHAPLTKVRETAEKRAQWKVFFTFQVTGTGRTKGVCLHLSSFELIYSYRARQGQWITRLWQFEPAVRNRMAGSEWVVWSIHQLLSNHFCG